MKKLFLTVAVISAIAAGANGPFSAVVWADTPTTSPTSTTLNQVWPAITVSMGGSAIVSTQGMQPGGEIWAEWYSLPPGQTVLETDSAAKWAYMELVLDGSAAIAGGPTPMCNVEGVANTGTDRMAGTGDVSVCNYALLPGARTANQGAEPYVFAALSVGGPWKQGMEDATELYLKVNGLGKATRVSPLQFGDVEKELLAAGKMRMSIRRITMPPGTRFTATDRFPTLRMVEKGQITMPLPSGSSTADAPKVLAQYDMLDWDPANTGKQFVLSNDGKEEAQLVEWSVTPVQDLQP